MTEQQRARLRWWVAAEKDLTLARATAHLRAHLRRLLRDRARRGL